LDEGKVQALELKDQFKNILEECRMVLPGIQALFGFQLIAVFNESFSKKLSTNQQIGHLVAIGLTTLAVVLAMAPAALHRLSTPDKVSEKLVKQSTGLLTMGMVPLMLGTVIDLFLLSEIILKDGSVPAAIAICFLAVFVAMWYVFPWLCRLQRREQQRASGKTVPQG
jgi:cellobiose-specific phosphotransferase system component IIC